MRQVKILIANLVLFLFAGLKTIKWKKSTKKVYQTQKDYLLALLNKNQKTLFGAKHCFENINSIEDFQKNVPLVSYEDIIPYINLIEKGKLDVLTSERVNRFGVSSGSTSDSKLIPYTKTLSSEFQNGINPWFWYLFKKFPSICQGRTYWSISPVGQKAKMTEGGIPIGFDDERMYFCKLDRFVLNTIQIAPIELSLIKDIDSFHYATLRFILEERKLSWISIWNPTFITLILSSLKNEIGNIIEDIEDGTLSYDYGLGLVNEKKLRSGLKKNPKRARELRLLCKKWGDQEFTELDGEGHTFFELLWPKLKVISCWADGEAINSLPKMKLFFPNVFIQPKGLIATEAFVSFPIENDKSALSINSHFFEFEPLSYTASRKIILTDELVVGKKYKVIVTTGGGLYRYQLDDIIVVLGFEKQCPLVKFLGKGDKVVDVMGEKLNEQFVKDAVVSVFSENSISPDFWIIAPEQFSTEYVSYTIFIHSVSSEIPDDMLRKVSLQIENKLLSSYHYNYCRQLGQLGKLKVFSIFSDNPDQTYLVTCLGLGQRLGDIKTTVLHPFKQWSTKFQGRFV